MNKAELVDSIAQSCQANLTKKQYSEVVDSVFDAVSEALAKQEKVVLVGFGTFEVRERAERLGRNPSTNETIKIPASKAPVFKAGKALKEKVNG